MLFDHSFLVGKFLVVLRLGFVDQVVFMFLNWVSPLGRVFFLPWLFKQIQVLVEKGEQTREALGMRGRTIRAQNDLVAEKDHARH